MSRKKALLSRGQMRDLENVILKGLSLFIASFFWVNSWVSQDRPWGLQNKS